MKIGILTGGGDAPGLNAVIRGVTKPAQDYGMTVYGILDGFEGFVEGRAKELRNEDVSGILMQGGTILGSSNKGNPFHWPVEKDGKIEIVDKSGCRSGQISHIKVAGPKNWGKSIEILQLIEEANDQGLIIRADQYPYKRGMNSLRDTLPDWAKVGGNEVVIQRMS